MSISYYKYPKQEVQNERKADTFIPAFHQLYPKFRSSEKTVFTDNLLSDIFLTGNDNNIQLKRTFFF